MTRRTSRHSCKVSDKRGARDTKTLRETSVFLLYLEVAGEADDKTGIGQAS
jgi:hypothetical protein